MLMIAGRPMQHPCNFHHYTRTAPQKPMSAGYQSNCTCCAEMLRRCIATHAGLCLHALHSAICTVLCWHTAVLTHVKLQACCPCCVLLQCNAAVPMCLQTHQQEGVFQQLSCGVPLLRCAHTAGNEASSLLIYHLGPHVAAATAAAAVQV